MANNLTRSLLLLLAACALALPSLSAAQAEQAPQAKKTAAKKTKISKAAPKPKQAAMVIDANTGRVLHDQDGDLPRFPASLTKMMTLYMLFSEIEQGRASYSTEITISARAAGASPSKLDLKPGDQIQAIDAIKALVVKSANDIAIAVAEHIGGSESAFARMMTDRARQLGMRNTTFRNASGLPDPAQLSTARDMLTLAMRLQDDFPQHYRLFATETFVYRGKTYRSHNGLLRTFPGMDGIKTGYTRASGFNLVSSVRTDNKHVVAAVFGGKTAKARNQHMQMLLYRALEDASPRKTRTPSQMLIATQRPAAKPATTDVAWATETKAPAARAPAAKPPAQKAKPVAVEPPAPARAVRPARDEIAQVLAQGDDGSADEEPSIAAPPRLNWEALREAMAEEPERGHTGGSAHAQAGGAIGNLIRNSIVEGAPQEPTQQASTTFAQAGAAPARAPSTLNSQAIALAGAVSAPQAVGPAAGKPYEIQIGAYSSVQEAQNKLEFVRGRASGLLQGHSGITLPVQRDDGQIFRARFVHFSEEQASATCLELRRLAIDCFVMRAD